VQQYGERSAYKDWFDGLRFDQRSPYGDPFSYTPWHGHYSLVRLNQRHPHVQAHLFDAVRMWVDEFGIDGLRLDVADCLELEFMQALRGFTEGLRPDFWLMGEVIHGDYRRWVNPHTLHSVTNYEGYKSLYSSLVDKNYFEVAYSLNRLFGSGGMLAGQALYNFVDNHDVDRVASKLGNPALLYPLYLLLFTMPGVPSIYYGSEWGLEGKRTPYSDAALRPTLELEALQRSAPQPTLARDIARLAALRHAHPALRHGNYTQLHVAPEQLAFARHAQEESLVVMLNASASPIPLEVQVSAHHTHAVDVLNGGERFPVQAGKLRVENVFARWGRVLKLE
jgi:glycosidase